MREKGTSGLLKDWYSFNLKLVLQGIIIGFITGLIIVFYRIAISLGDESREKIYNFLRNESVIFIIGWFLFLGFTGLFLGYIVKIAPMSKGSGIPQIKGFLIHQIKLDWFKDIIAKFIGGVIALGFGLSLGREGPSVQIGAETGLGFSRLNKRLPVEEKFLVTAGASAGLASAFNAPLAGVMFALEELHKYISPVLLMSAMAASVTGDFVSRYFFGLGPIFQFEDMEVLPLSSYIYVIFLGIIIGFLGKLFNWVILFVQSNYSENKSIRDIYKPVLPLLVSGFLGFTLPEVLGGGHHLIDELSTGHLAAGFIFFLFIVKIIFTGISYGAGVPGGIFLPMLVLGALAGKGVGEVFYGFGMIQGNFVLNFMTLAMAAFFTAVVKAPITGTILIMEMTGTFNHLLALITICLTSYIVADVIGSKAIYEILLERLLENSKKTPNKRKKRSSGKSILEIPVMGGSEVEGKKIKEIKWPERFLIVSIRRGEEELIPDGNFEIYSGDCLVILADNDEAPLVKEELLKITSD
jgi:H+/Cl- antiporter ClcA